MGQHALSSEWIIQYLQKNEAKPVEITVARDGQQLKFNATPVLTENTGKPLYRVGLGLGAPMHVGKLPFTQAFDRSIQQNKKYSLLIVDLVHKMVERKVSIKQMEGPIGIARASGDAARQPGWTPLLGLMAMISLNLGIFNLLPIPILDGGIISAADHRGRHPARHQHPHQGADLSDGVCLLAAVLRGRDLQRLDESFAGLAQRLP